IKKSGGNRSAGLQVAVVGEEIIFAKSFAGGSGADPTGDVHFLATHISPQTESGLAIIVAAIDAGERGNAAAQQGRPDRMAFDGCLFENRFVILIVRTIR